MDGNPEFADTFPVKVTACPTKWLHFFLDPTGTVIFPDYTTALGDGDAESVEATFPASSLAAGVHNIISHGGSSDSGASTSTAWSETGG